MWRGLIEAYRDRLPVTDAHAGGHPARGQHAAACRRRCCPQRTGCDVYLKVEGANPTGSFKDRGMTMAVSKAVEAGAKAIICASTGNTQRLRRRVRRPGRPDLRGARAAGQDRARQAGPGARARRQAAAGQRQLRRLPGAGLASCRRTTRWRWSTRSTSYRLHGQKTAAFEIVEALGDAPGHPLPAGRQRRQHLRVLDGLPRGPRRRQRHASCRRCTASRRPAPRRSSTAQVVPRAVDHRHRDPDRQPGALDQGARRPGRVRRPDRAR